MNTLYYGDNLKILRESIATESVDLIYLDPPFNSSRSYNVLFKDESGEDSPAQITAFEDTWHWNQAAEATYNELVTTASPNVSKMVGALRDFLGSNQIMAYLVMMSARLVELHRVLKPTGSLYLHCDPTASHYLKIVLDSIFGVENFRNEIIWQRTSAGKPIYHNLPKNADHILWYVKSDGYKFNPVLLPLEDEDIATFNLNDNDGRGPYNTQPIINPGYRPNLRYVYSDKQGKKWQPPKNGWRFNEGRMKELEENNRLYFGKTIREKYYLEERLKKGKQVSNIWIDLPPTPNNEMLGYPTQKPVALLERIINASSNAGDLVLDPFCGCGTTIAAAQKLGRNWIGIDITHLAIALQKYRLKDSFGLVEKKDYAVIGEPEDLPSAKQLKEDDPYQFQFWAVSLIKARPLGGVVGRKDGKKGKDKGIDGVISFIDEANGKPKQILVQVKSGKVKSGDIRDLRGTIEREQAAIGVFITLEKPSKDMLAEAATAGFYHSPGWNKDYPKLQIITVAELLEGTEVKMPPSAITFKQAEKVTIKPKTKQSDLF